MLVVETVARIRRAHFVQGKGIKEIARELGIARNTVRKVLRSGETAFAYCPTSGLMRQPGRLEERRISGSS